MLTLTRHATGEPGSAVHIDTPAGRATVRVLSARGDKVRLGLDGPQAVVFVRDDVINPAPRAPGPLDASWEDCWTLAGPYQPEAGVQALLCRDIGGEG